MAKSNKSKHKAKAAKKKQRKSKNEEKRRKALQRKKQAVYKKYASIAIIAAIAIFLVKDFYVAEPGDPAFEIPIKTIDLGDVSLAAGIVATSFEIKNTGGGPLIINDMETSCGCTSASIIYDEVEGPLFNMRGHGTNPTNWLVEIPSGHTAKLKVYYNPAVHPDHTGPTTRSITLFSNAPVNGVQEAYIKLNQVS
jgi:hypothetical protein